MSTPYVAVLEDNAARLAAMRPVLGALLPQFEHVYFEDAGTVVLWLDDHLADVVLLSLDHDLPFWRTADNVLIDAGTGREVADYLAGRPAVCPVIVHTSNQVCGDGMMWALRDADWPAYRVVPTRDPAWVADGWAATIRHLKANGMIFAREDV
jgi:hypothetical protein